MPGWQRYLGWGVTLATLAIYALMVTVTLPHLSELAGGMPMFDMRPGGYDYETAREILTALGEEGRSYYAGIQHVLDAIFPPFVGLTLAYWLWRAAPRWRNAGLPMSTMALGILIGLGFLAAAFDLAENAMVDAMLSAGPNGITPSLVSATSALTLAKSVMSTIAYSALLVVGLGPLVARRMRRGEG